MQTCLNKLYETQKEKKKTFFSVTKSEHAQQNVSALHKYLKNIYSHIS